MNSVLAETQSVTRQSVGDLLRAERQRRGLTLDDIAQRTFIKLHYLEALESGQFERLPAPVYTSGYIRQYARMLGLDDTQLVQHYQNQKQLDEPLQASEQELFKPVLSQQDGRKRIDTVQISQNDKEEATMSQMSPKGNSKQVVNTISGDRKDSLAMRHQTEQFADQVFSHLEDEIEKVLAIVKNGREYLQQRLDSYQL